MSNYYIGIHISKHWVVVSFYYFAREYLAYRVDIE